MKEEFEMRTNVRQSNALRTHEGAPALIQSNIAALRRAVSSCLLWEDEFYEDGVSIAKRIQDLASRVPVHEVAQLAVELRTQGNLRHVALWLVLSVIERRLGAAFDTASLIHEVCRRADEPGELLALYWKDGRRPIPSAMRRGLGRALTKFDAYQIGKYARDATVSLKDVVRLGHPKAANDDQSGVFKRLLDGTLESPDTWEVGLSSGADKRETFERLLREQNLGYLALLRNLRKMSEVGVDAELIKNAIVARKGAQNVLPFRYVAAARAAPQFEPWLDASLCMAVQEMPLFTGRTIVLVDVSDSMNAKLSAKSDLTRMDAAATLASIIHGDVRMFSFSTEVKEVPARRGMAGVDAIKGSQPHRGTYLGAAIQQVNRFPHDRLICITDEQSHDPVGSAKADKAYMVNVASTERAVGYGKWTRISGFSENILSWIHAVENENND
jgi:60 kDa SS-A/Ro ribonucleoprotein